MEIRRVPSSTRLTDVILEARTHVDGSDIRGIMRDLEMTVESGMHGHLMSMTSPYMMPEHDLEKYFRRGNAIVIIVTPTKVIKEFVQGQPYDITTKTPVKSKSNSNEEEQILLLL